MWAWQFSKALYTSEIRGFEKFTSMQNKWNLLYREEEREMIPLCKSQNIGIIPWSPTAVGVLSDKYFKDGKLVVGKDDIQRLQPNSNGYRDYIEPPENSEIVRRVLELAQSKGVKPTQIAVTWLICKGATAPIIGTVTPEHLQDAVEAVGVKLSDSDVRYLEEPYRPKPITSQT